MWERPPHAPADPPTPAAPAPARAISPPAGSSRTPSSPADPAPPPTIAHPLPVQFQYSFSFSFHSPRRPMRRTRIQPMLDGQANRKHRPLPNLALHTDAPLMLGNNF